MIALLRIDDRLIHGQITTAWMSNSGAKRIIIASDDVANDQMRKMIVDATAPKGTKVLSIKEAAAELKNSGNERIFVICAAPKEVIALAREDLQFETVIVGNVGGLEQHSGSTKRTKLSKSVFVNDEDITAFRQLQERGIKSFIRVVPKDRPVNIYELLDKI